MRPVGYYVHHHGMGHWHRAAALARHMRHPVTLIGTVAEPREAPCPVLALPDDAGADPRNGDPAGVPGLHYAPVHHEGMRARGAIMAEWIARERPALMVVDVSVEVAVLSRLLSTPFLYFRLAGTRDDPPHLTAFRAAEALIAPFPDALEDPATPDWMRAKTFHAGFLSGGGAAPLSGGGIVAAFGRGGAGGDASALAAAARAVPDRRWRVLGPVSGSADLPPNLELLGWREDASAILAEADLVIGGGGDGLVAEVAALGKRFLCLPEPRPFDEQGVKARRLAAMGAAVVREEWPQDWTDTIAAALALDPARIAALHDPQAMARTAAFIDGVAARFDAL
ncbi:glycosyltransferase [Pararoseomonas sp. SCSIO 73927]|uniref:glycosyltransferase n=1 Tax=Pararoseomonas sp. SCSIO 73927 TaxID=3114537 RepID=UPI0030CD6A5A